MMNGNSQPDARFERVDADAVCAECGTINPEDTLLCKVCGNNLRDQRARRVIGEHSGEAETERRGFPLLFKLLALLAFLLVILVTVNLRQIEDNLMGGAVSDSNAKQYWRSADSDAYSELLEALKAAPVTEEESKRAQMNTAATDIYDGRYTLIGSNVMGRKYIVGHANVRQVDDRLLFVALIKDGACEVRGEALIEEDGQFASRDMTGINYEDRYYGASGIVSTLETGGYDCTGTSDYDGVAYSVTAYRVPE